MFQAFHFIYSFESYGFYVFSRFISTVYNVPIVKVKYELLDKMCSTPVYRYCIHDTIELEVELTAIHAAYYKLQTKRVLDFFSRCFSLSCDKLHSEKACISRPETLLIHWIHGNSGLLLPRKYHLPYMMINWIWRCKKKNFQSMESYEAKSLFRLPKIHEFPRSYWGKEN